MMPKFKGKTKPKLHKPSMETVMRWMVTLLLGFVVLLPVFAGVTQYEQNRAKADVEDVLAFYAERAAVSTTTTAWPIPPKRCKIF